MRKAFTLIELLIVVSIIGILATVLVPNVVGAGARARDAARTAGAKNIVEAIESFYIDNQRYPVPAESPGQFCIGSIDDGEGAPPADETTLINNYLKGEVPTYKSVVGESNAEYCDDGTDGHYIYWTHDPSDSRSYSVGFLVEKEQEGDAELVISETLTVYGRAIER